MGYYLDKLGIKKEDTPWGRNEDDPRQEIWKIEREKYGFDERETWSLDYTMDILLYERLYRYKEMAEGFIDLEYYKFEFKGETLTQKECIDRMLKGLELRIKCQGFFEGTDEERKLMDDVYKLYDLCKDNLWW